MGDGEKKFQEVGAKLKAEINASEQAKQEAEKNVVVYKVENLENDMKLGMSKVDSADIRPPQILLIQKSSDLGSFQTSEGVQPKAGQFFHTGKMEIYDTFDCYVLFAAKGTYIEKRKTSKYFSQERDKYNMIGALSSDISFFGMLFRSTATNALSPLFTAVVTNKRPMFSFIVRFEKKELADNEGNKWFVPVCRIISKEDDGKALQTLREMAGEFDSKADRIVKVNEEDDQADQTPF